MCDRGFNNLEFLKDALDGMLKLTRQSFPSKSPYPQKAVPALSTPNSVAFPGRFLPRKFDAKFSANSPTPEYMSCAISVAPDFILLMVYPY